MSPIHPSGMLFLAGVVQCGLIKFKNFVSPYTGLKYVGTFTWGLASNSTVKWRIDALYVQNKVTEQMEESLWLDNYYIDDYVSVGNKLFNPSWYSK